MAITNLELITDALREINVINEVQSASAEQGTQCLKKLNQLMEIWKEDSLNIGWFKQTDTSADAPVPDYAETAVMLALGVRAAPQYGASISVEYAAALTMALKVLRRKLIVEGLDNTDMTHLPEGTGHWGSRYNITSDT